MPYSYFIFTSNVDGQFQKAGFDPNKIVEIHGSIHYLQCTLPCSNKIWPADNIEVKIDFNQFKALDPLPKCPLCGRIARPNILMFNDFYWISSRTDKQEQKFNSWLDYLFKNKIPTIIFEIGAGTAVPTVRYTSENLALKLNAPLIRINPRDYQIPQNPKFIPIPHTALHALQNIDLILKKIQK
jgi:NAD-dependent SIR2 family protein deacetylase